MVIGPFAAAQGLLVMWWETDHVGRAGYVPAVLVPLIGIGIGIGLTLPSATLIATDSVQADEAGLVSGLLNTNRQFGSALGLAILFTTGTRRATVVRNQIEGAHMASGVPTGYSEAALTGAVIAIAAGIVALMFALLRAPGSPDSGATASKRASDGC